MEITTKLQVLNQGLDYLDTVGIEAICRVCIARGGSCCKRCPHLKENDGCQMRNTSCTAWLCGFQKYLFFELGLLEGWDSFWNQIPGLDFRRDFTPDLVCIPIRLDKPDPGLRLLCEAFARDLEEICERNNTDISQFNSTLDLYMQKLSLYQDSEITRFVHKKLKLLMQDFKHFKSGKETV